MDSFEPAQREKQIAKSDCKKNDRENDSRTPVPEEAGRGEEAREKDEEGGDDEPVKPQEHVFAKGRQSFGQGRRAQGDGGQDPAVRAPQRKIEGLDFVRPAGLAGELVALDGKTLRRSRARGHGPIHLVNVWAARNRLVLGQLKVDDHSNEITALPELLRALELVGCVVTVDALGCQKDVAKEIL